MEADCQRVRLRVLSPQVRLSEAQLQVPVSTTVREVKTILLSRLPSRPPLSDLRLLYAGKLLSDESCLSDFLRISDDSQHCDQCPVHTLHLSCSQQTSLQNSLQTPLHTEASHNFYWEEEQQGYQNTDIDQMAVMTELYSLYITQYLQYLQYLHTMSQAPQDMPEPDPHPPDGDRPVLEAEQDNGAGEDRDLLDWTYLTLRAVLLLSIVYFKSSLTSLAVVIGFAGLIYLYQSFVRVLVRDLRRLGDRNLRDLRQRIRDWEDDVTEEEIRELENNQENRPRDIGLLVSCVVFTFFASLVPENNHLNL